MDAMRGLNDEKGRGNVSENMGGSTNSNTGDNSGGSTSCNAGGNTGDNSGRNTVRREDAVLLGGCMILGLLFDILFYKKALGISYPLYIAVFYAVFIAAYRSGGTAPAGLRLSGTGDLWNLDRHMGWLLLIPAALLALTYFLFSNEIFMTLNFMAVPILVAAQTVIATRRGRYAWHQLRFIRDILYGVFCRPFIYIGKPFSLAAAMMRRKKIQSRYAVFGKVLIGLLVSLPLAIVVVALLSSADQVFESFIDRIPNLFSGWEVEEVFAKTFYAVCTFFLFFSYIWSLTRPAEIHGADDGAPVDYRPVSGSQMPGSGDGASADYRPVSRVEEPGAKGGIPEVMPEVMHEAMPEGMPERMHGAMYAGVRPVARKARRGWDPVVVMTMLFSVDIIYVFFVLIQFTYLFGSLSYGLPEDFTYAEYARRGFFELVAVTLINFSILLGCLYFTRKGGRTSERLLKALYTLLVVCTLVMLFSAHFRMSLYEDAYGYTYLRMLTHAFMVFLFVLFMMALYRIWKEGVSLAKPYIITAIIAYLIINYINIDVVIARNNIDRYYKTGDIDLGYLMGLSCDAVPQMTRLLDCKDEGVAAIVENYLFDRKEALSGGKPWPSFNLSEYRAKAVLSKHTLSHRETGRESTEYNR